jgi:GTPase SAR1 family protein
MPTYLRGAQLCFIVFSLVDRDSFESLDEWHRSVRDHLSEDVPICLVGNKSDLTTERVVDRNEAEQWTERQRVIAYVETSAVTLDGLPELLESGMRHVFAQDTRNVEAAIQPEQAEKRQCCETFG